MQNRLIPHQRVIDKSQKEYLGHEGSPRRVRVLIPTATLSLGFQCQKEMYP